MKWDQVSELNCPIARSLSLLGDRWTLLVIRNAFMRTRRFDDFQKQLGMTRHLLAERLSRLVHDGVFEKVLYQEKPKRYEYKLTDKGLALYPILLAYTAWGNTWMNDDNKIIEIEYVHTPCDHKTSLSLRCSECHEVLLPKEMKPFISIEP